MALNDRRRSVPAVANVGATEAVAVPTAESAAAAVAVDARGEGSAPALGATVAPSMLTPITTEATAANRDSHANHLSAR